MDIYLMLNGTQVGPYKIEDVQGWVKAGYVKMDDPAWYEESKDWITVREVPGIDKVKSVQTIDGHPVPPFEAYEGDEPYVFISYAHKDSSQVFEEIGALKDAGYNIWYDEGIEASNEWPEEIANAVIGCSVFLVFISPRSTSSVNCRNEINLALNEDKPFLAVHLEESSLPPGLRLRMGDLQAILQYKLPLDRYQKKVRDALDQLLGKKKKKIRSRPASATATTFAKMETHDNLGTTRGVKSKGKKKLKTTASTVSQTSDASQPRKKKLGLWLGIAAALIALIAGYSFFGSDRGKDVESTATFVEGQPWTVPFIGLEMIWCEPGTFMMGSPDDEKGRKNEETRHEVTLTQGFFLGKFEVTQDEWKAVMRTAPSKFFGPNRPVEQINWEQAKRFCEELTVTERKAGRLPEDWSYDLPTEAQWEYACRAGTFTMFPWGKAIGSTHANYNGSGIGVTTEGGQYPPNAWGFHDMIGNVAEWCADFYEPFTTLPSVDPLGTSKGIYRVVRGNSYIDKSENARIGRRLKMKNNYKGRTGFRLCLRQNTLRPSGAESQAVFSPPIELDLTRGLAGWWKFDEKIGKIANDSSGSIRAGKLIGYSSDIAQWSKGVIGNALSFDGKGSHVDIGDFEWGGESSVSFWARWEASHRGSVILSVVDESYLALSNTFGYKNLQLIVRNDLSVTNVNHGNTPELREFWKLGEWVHAAVTFKKTNQFEVYRNGKMVMVKEFPTLKKIKRSDQFIGRRNSGVGFKGQLDDFRMYDRAITPTEVEGLFALATKPDLSINKGSTVLSVLPSSPQKHQISKVDLNHGLAGWWTFDETKGRVANDSSGRKRNGALKNFDSDTAQWVKGPIGNALQFDGKNDYVDVGDFKWGGECSFSGWVKFDEFGFWTRVVDFGLGPNENEFAISSGDAKKKGSLVIIIRGRGEIPISNHFFKSKEWIHLALVMNNNRSLKIFGGGNEIASAVLKDLPGELVRDKQFFGKSQMQRDAYLKGQIDDFRIYDRALVETEVQALYAMGEVPDEKSFSKELLRAVDNWKRVPPNVFPLPEVAVYIKIDFRDSTKKGNWSIKSGDKIVVLSKKDNLLTVSPSGKSKLRGTIDISQTNFRQRVADLFEIRKKQRAAIE
ncbi:MAG: SUMF1/EgtB/PvdO family nonheme iron enzyme [Opitutae bacterium]|nr:SUMF1/EgtB/PvdO family nonheme iron enzyme [Opitutae bacterium]